MIRRQFCPSIPCRNKKLHDCHHNSDPRQLTKILYGRINYFGCKTMIKEQTVQGMDDYSQCKVRSAGFTKNSHLVILNIITEF